MAEIYDEEMLSGILLFLLGGPGLFMVILGSILWLADHRESSGESVLPPSGFRMVKAGAFLILVVLAALVFDAVVVN